MSHYNISKSHVNDWSTFDILSNNIHVYKMPSLLVKWPGIERVVLWTCGENKGIKSRWRYI